MATQAQVIKTKMPTPAPTPEALLKQVHAALAEMKAKDAVEIDVRGKTSIADFLVVVSGTSTRHVKSIADEVVRFAKKCGPRTSRRLLHGMQLALCGLLVIAMLIVRRLSRQPLNSRNSS